VISIPASCFERQDKQKELKMQVYTYKTGGKDPKQALLPHNDMEF
jgi:hypothetical protein